MLTEKEIAFIENWETVRIKYSSFSSKLVRGLPFAFLFVFPVILSIVMIYFFSPDWFTKISQQAFSSSFAIILGVLISILFFSFTRMHFKWEMNEQLYLELKNKRARENKSE